MAKSTVLHARVDSNLKEDVDYIFAQLGLTPSDAINLFYKQVEMNNGLPFEVKIPQKLLSEKKLLNELDKGRESGNKEGWLTLEESKRKLGI